MDSKIKLEQVEDRLARQALELQQSKESLGRFTYAISHELNSPIRMLNSLLDMLNEEHRTQLDCEGAELLDMIRVSAGRTQALVGGIIDYSSYCNPDSRYTHVDVQSVLGDVLDELAPVIADKKANISAEPMPSITSSADALRQLLYHLIQNALIYNDKEQPADVSIRCTESVEGYEWIIEDKGLGIDPSHYERIFSPFERLNPKSKYEGAGLGLSQCRQIVNALQGRLWVIPNQPRGSRFHVFLPRLPEQP